MANLNAPNGSTNLSRKILDEEAKLERMAQSAGKRVGEMASDFANTTADSMKTSREYVTKNPGKSIIYAAAAGLVAGSLLAVVLCGRKN